MTTATSTPWCTASAICLAMPDTTAGSRPMRPPPNTSPESLRRTRWKGVVWASVMAQGLLVGSVPAVGRSFHIPRTSAASGSGGTDLGQQAREHGREADVVVLVAVRRGGEPHVATTAEGHGGHDDPGGIQPLPQGLRVLGRRRHPDGQRDEAQARGGGYAAVQAVRAQGVPDELGPTQEQVGVAVDLLPATE